MNGMGSKQEINRAPEWIKGTFVWRVVAPDGDDCVAKTAEAVAEVQNLFDGTVRSCIITSGFIGHDESSCNWDGTWPYIDRPTHRVGHCWETLGKFMMDMRDNHNAWISFHTNITDVNVGLHSYPETRDFFEKMRAAKAMFTRDGEGCGVALKGAAYVPQRIPFDVVKMPYVSAGDPMDIFAIVNYKNFWDSGLAKEMIDAFFAKLPYPPLMLYLDVLTTTGSNLTAGLPDGLLGGSEATQREGRRNILEYVRTKGSEPGGESPSWWTSYNWNHGGMSANDYSRIETGWAQGCMAWRGAEWQHVHGNQGAYSLDIGGKLIAKDMQFTAIEGGGTAMTSIDTAGVKAASSETAEWRTQAQVVEGFYLTAIQELYHMGLGNVRLPGGAGIQRLDEHCGRLNIDRVDVYSAAHQLLSGMQASDGELTKPCAIAVDNGSTNGKVVTGLDGSLAGRCKATLDVPATATGDGFVVVRYISPLGGTAEVEINGQSLGELQFPATTERPGIFSDFAIPVRLVAGTNTIAFGKGSIYARWSDGTEARWDRHGFRAANGDVIFGIGYDRMWPDTWSGQKKIYFYSRSGTQRAWKLPCSWRDLKTVTLYPLTPEGRGQGITLAVKDGQVSSNLAPQQPYVIV